MRDLLLVAIVVVCALVALRRPVFGMLTFACLGFLNPHSMAWNLYRTVPLVQLVAGGTIIGYVFSSEPKRIPRQRESLLLLALWTMFAISTVLALYPDRAFERLVYISKILFMVFLATSLLNSEARLKWLVRVIALSLGFFGLKLGVFALSRGGNSMVFGPEGSFLYANNSIGLALAMNVPLLYYLAGMERRRSLRWLMWAMLVFSYPAVIFTYSRGAWLALATVTLLIVLRSRYRTALLAVGVTAGLAAVPFVPHVVPERLVDRYNTLVNYAEDTSAQSRLWDWEFCKRVSMARPISGAGFDFYTTETYEAYFPEFLEQYPTKTWSCHSIWLTMLGEHGFPGLALWVALVGSYLLSLRRMLARARRDPAAAWVVPYAHLLQSSLIAYIVAGTFLDAAYFDMFYYLVAAIIIINERLQALPNAGAVAAAPGFQLAPRPV